MNQISAGLKKEIIFFWRSFRFCGMVLLFLGCALLYPLVSGMTVLMGEALGINGTELYGAGMQGMPETEMVEALFGVFTPQFTYVSSLTMISSAVILMMILLTGTAGAEQKKRSIIIPQTAGLTPAGYVMPKFILYPPMVFTLTLISAIISNAACHVVFGESNPTGLVLVTGALYGVSSMFTICLYLFLGVSLAQPGLSVLYVLAADAVFSLMITVTMNLNSFTPWNLTGMANNIVYSQVEELNLLHSYSFPPYAISEQSIFVTVAITLALCVIFLLLTLFAMNAKRMDNTADEVY